GTGPVGAPGPPPDNLGEAQVKLAEANRRIQTLTERVDELQGQLQLASAKVNDFQRRIDELTSANPPPQPNPGAEVERLRKENSELSNRIQTTTRELQLTTQILNSERELCKLKEPTCR